MSVSPCISFIPVCVSVWVSLSHGLSLLSISVSPFPVSLSCIFPISLSRPSDPLSFILPPSLLTCPFLASSISGLSRC